MTGLLLIGIVIAWIAIAVFISKWAVRSIKSPLIKAAVAMPIFSVLSVAPLGDEIVGKHQFEALCRKYSAQYVDTEHAMNRRVISIQKESTQFATGTAVKLRIDPWVYQDAETGRVLISYHTVDAEGGWLIRFLGISETKSPLIFGSYCAPENQDAFKKKFNITVIN